MRRVLYIVIFLTGFTQFASGQGPGRNRLIQVNGIITDFENHPVPHVSIISTRLRRGTVSEMSGIYSLISVPGDTVFVSALGYKRLTFQVPPGFDGRLYKKDLMLVSDTISIEGITIFPWKNYEEFKREVLANLPVMKPEIKNMYDNLAAIQYYIENTPSYRVSPEAGFRMAMNQHVDRYISNQQYPSNNLLNPVAWARFFSGMKNGLLKNQKTDQDKKVKVRTRKKKSNQD